MANDALTSPQAMAIELNLTMFEKVARSYGWTSNTDIAAALGISERQVTRVRSGKSRPGSTFIAGLLSAAEETGFRRLFRVVPESAPIGKD
jgi:transcriptional regulator with XRE-family HTH domain